MKANQALGHICKPVASRSREMNNPLCSACVKPCVSETLKNWTWSSGRPPRWLHGWRTWHMKKGWRQVLLKTMEEIHVARPREGKVQGDLIMVFQYLGGSYKLYTGIHGDRTRGSGHKLLQGKFCLDIRKKSFTVWVVKHWITLSGELGEVFKTWHDKALDNLT